MTVRTATISRLLNALLIGSALITLSACGGLKSLKDVPEYLDSEFDNAAPREFITPADLAKVKVGMSLTAVRNRIGRPLIGDKTEQDRYDYVVKTTKDGKVELTPYAIYFVDGYVTKIVAIEGNPSAIDSTPVMPAASPAPAAVTPVAESQPAMAAPESAAMTASSSGEVEDSIKGWASAWANQDTKAYLGYYSSAFKPDSGSRASWEAQRSARLSSPSKIELTISDLAIAKISETSAKVTFKQGYVSNKFKENGKKTLLMVKEDGVWKIVRESFKR